MPLTADNNYKINEIVLNDKKINCSSIASEVHVQNIIERSFIISIKALNVRKCSNSESWKVTENPMKY